jgi:hypothetical protein
MQAFEKYQRYVDEKEYQEAILKLKKENIQYKIEDRSFSLNELNPGMRTIELDLYLKKQDFDRADKILLCTEESNQYYLYDFSNEELLEVILKEEEWSKFDIDLARTILKERGKTIDEEILHNVKEIRIKEMAKPEESQKAWIYAGYVFAFLGGIISIFIGLHLKTYKKTLPNGTKVYAFSKNDRKHGSIITILGTIFSAIYIIIRFVFINQ